MRSRLRRALPSALAVSVAAAGLLGGAGTSPATAASGGVISAGTFNVCKVDCAAPAPSWDVRRDRVGRVIAASGVDVLGLQEATNNATSIAKTQVEDIQQLVQPLGYVGPTYPVEANECRRPRDARGELAGPSPCENTSSLLFKSSTIRQVSVPAGISSAGIAQTASIAPGVEPRAGARSVAWAYLEAVDGSTGPFLAVSLHTDNAKDADGEAARMFVAQSLTGWVTALNAAHGMDGVPVLLMADLNSYDKRQPNGAQTILRKTGWIDGFTAPTRKNIQYSTINYNPQLKGEQGFPLKPYKFKKTKKNPIGAATRIDYVFGFGALKPLSYEVMIFLQPDGKFVPDYQASDHQMVRTTWRLHP